MLAGILLTLCYPSQIKPMTSTLEPMDFVQLRKPVANGPLAISTNGDAFGVRIWEQSRPSHFADASLIGMVWPVRKNTIVLERVDGAQLIVGPRYSLPGKTSELSLDVEIRRLVVVSLERAGKHQLANRIRADKSSVSVWRRGLIHDMYCLLSFLGAWICAAATVRSVLMTREEIQARRRRHNMCSTCMYPISISAVCPECGTPNSGHIGRPAESIIDGVSRP